MTALRPKSCLVGTVPPVSKESQWRDLPTGTTPHYDRIAPAGTTLRYVFAHVQPDTSFPEHRLATWSEVSHLLHHHAQIPHEMAYETVRCSGAQCQDDADNMRTPVIRFHRPTEGRPLQPFVSFEYSSQQPAGHTWQLFVQV